MKTTVYPFLVILVLSITFACSEDKEPNSDEIARKKVSQKVPGNEPIDQVNKVYHYYYNGEKVFLNIDYSRILIVSENEYTVGDVLITPTVTFIIETSSKDYTMYHIVPEKDITSLSPDDLFITEIKTSDKINPVEYFNIINNLKQDKNVVHVSPSYLLSNEQLGISNNFYVKLFKEEDITMLYSLAEQNSIQVLGHNKYMPLWYTLSCGKETSLNALEAANLFFETTLFDKSEPEFLNHNSLLSEGQELTTEYLIGASWKLVAFVNGADGTSKTPESVSENNYWITFNKDGTFSAKSAVNELEGSYTINPATSTISITELGGTKIHEQPDGHLFVEQLQSIQSFSVEQSSLKLYHTEKDYLLFLLNTL
jgi:heat shock protein HslJ